jgi:hypothetical protein
MQQHRKFHGMARYLLVCAGEQTEQGWHFEGERYRFEGQEGRLTVTRKIDQIVIYEGLKAKSTYGMPTVLQVKYTQGDWNVLEGAVKRIQAQLEQQQQKPSLGFGR